MWKERAKPTKWSSDLHTRQHMCAHNSNDNNKI